MKEAKTEQIAQGLLMASHVWASHVNFRSSDGIDLWLVVLNGSGSCRSEVGVRQSCLEIQDRERQRWED